MSTPISFSSKPPSLFRNAAVSKNPEEEPPKPQRAGGRKKKTRRGGDTMMVDDAPRIIDSPSSDYKSKKSAHKFTEDITETDAYEPETEAPDSPQSLSELDFSKINLGLRYGHAPVGPITIRESAGFISEGASMEDEGDDSSLDSVISRGLFELPCTHGLVNKFKSSVKSNLMKQLKGMVTGDKEPTTEFVIEIADSIDLLRLLGASDSMLDDMGRKAREGARQYKKGLEVMNHGQGLLGSFLSDISSLK